MFSVHTKKPKEFKNATIAGHFGLVFGISRTGIPSCSTDSVFKCFLPHENEKPFVFNFLRFMKGVSKSSVLVRTVGLTVEISLQHHGVDSALQ